MKFILWLLVLFLCAFGALILPLPHFIEFKQNCSCYMKRAADANTIEMAIPEMEKVVAYIEKNGLTNGYTHLLIQTPKGDLSFWYKNMQAALSELQSIKSDASQLEKSNVLMKLRETLVDHDKDGENLTCPPYVAFYPHQRLIVWLSYFFAFLFLFVLMAGLFYASTTY